MKFYEFGNREAHVIMLLSGTCCHWKRNFGEVIPLLEKYFRVVCVSYDGFDETEDTVFDDMISQTDKIEKYIIENHGGHIKAAYGCSLGGSFVGLLVQRQVIHIEHGILGSSDLDQDKMWKAKLKCKIAVPLLHKIVSTGEYPKILQEVMEKKRSPYRDKFMEMFGIGNGGLPFIKRESIYNQFYKDLITPLEKNISVPGTTIHCIFAKKMGELYLERYKEHFHTPVIHEFDMEHEELLILYPEQWANEIRRMC